MEELSIRALSAADAQWFPEGIALLNRTQGVGLFSECYLDRFAARSDALIAAAFANGKLVGVSVAERLEKLDYFLPFQPILAEELRGVFVASFTTLSVEESWQGRGVGQRLCRMRLDWLRAQRCSVVLGVSWESGLAHTSNRTFEKLGFRAVAKLHNFYEESSLRAPFDCPGCHAIPCTCGAILYRLDQ
jgi:GNAT superfamily N-acetyltransferase